MGKSHLNREQTVDKNGRVTHVHRVWGNAESLRKERIERLGKLVRRDMNFDEFLREAKKNKSFRKFSKLVESMERRKKSDDVGDVPATKRAAASLADIYRNAMRSKTDGYGVNVYEYLNLGVRRMDELNPRLFSTEDAITLANWEPDSLTDSIYAYPDHPEGPRVRLNMAGLIKNARAHINNGAQNEFESVWLMSKHPFIKQLLANQWGATYTVGEVTDFLKKNPDSLKRINARPESGFGEHGGSRIGYSLSYIAFNLEQKFGDQVDGRKEALNWMAFLYDAEERREPKMNRDSTRAVGYTGPPTEVGWDAISDGLAQKVRYDVFRGYYDVGIRDVDFIIKMADSDIDPNIAYITYFSNPT